MSGDATYFCLPTIANSFPATRKYAHFYRTCPTFFSLLHSSAQQHSTLWFPLFPWHNPRSPSLLLQSLAGDPLLLFCALRQRKSPIKKEKERERDSTPPHLSSSSRTVGRSVHFRYDSSPRLMLVRRRRSPPSVMV